MHASPLHLTSMIRLGLLNHTRSLSQAAEAAKVTLALLRQAADRNVNPTNNHPSRSVLPLVHSSINLTLPSGQFDNPTVTHRASCNVGSIPPEEEENLLPMFLDAPSPKNPVGFLRPNVVEQILSNNEENGEESMWNVLRRDHDGSPWAVCFADHVSDFKTRSDSMGAVLRAWKEKGLFPDILKGWSDETYPVYTPRNQHLNASTSVAFGIERAALPLFGFANFGCLLTAFYDCPTTRKTMLWIPRRSFSKSTWPGRYDCTVGGGMGLGEKPSDTIIRECTEEASLPPAFVRSNLRSTGMLSFMNRSPSKWILPGIYYLYELRLPSDGSIEPRTNSMDNEVDSFLLMSVDDAMNLLVDGAFKPSSAMALVDFCIRRGIITPESDPAYLDVCMAMRRPVVLPYPSP